MPRSPALRLLILAGLLAAAWLAARATGVLEYANPARLQEAVSRARGWSWSAPAFVAGYILASSLGLPASPLTLAGGALFGVGLGSALNWVGASLGALGAYTVARRLGGDAVRALLGSRGNALDRLAGEAAFPALLRLRLIPVIPFNGLNFGAGLAGVRPVPFLASTALGIIPGTVVYTYFADALLAGAAGARREAFVHLTVASVLLLALSFAPFLARRLGLLAALLLLSALGGVAGRASAQGALVDHAPFSAMLAAYVRDGLVDYDGLAGDGRFDPYLRALEQGDPARMAPPERLAFWINVYNAYTIQLIRLRGERRSIRNINKRFGIPIKSPWSEPIVRAAGRTLSLDDVEHRIIRREFAEPRVHMALVCAALGCPPLRGEAYVGARLDAQLDDQARRFLATAAKNRVDVATRTVYGSPIFSWYRDDFGGTLAGVGRFWARYVTGDAERALLLSGSFAWRDTPYDWSLNVRPAASTPAAPGR